jgi:hypothetical protein
MVFFGYKNGNIWMKLNLGEIPPLPAINLTHKPEKAFQVPG